MNALQLVIAITLPPATTAAAAERTSATISQGLLQDAESLKETVLAKRLAPDTRTCVRSQTAFIQAAASQLSSPTCEDKGAIAEALTDVAMLNEVLRTATLPRATRLQVRGQSPAMTVDLKILAARAASTCMR
jgi:hypothetical protein